MAPLLIKDVVIYSSEDPRYPARNILIGQKWLTDPKETSGKDMIELQLNKASEIHYIDIGYSNISSMEIYVGRSSWSTSQEYKIILPTVMLQNPMEGRTGQNKMGCRMFNYPEHLNSEYANEKWDRVRINLSQTFAKNKQMGLEFVRLGSPRNVAESRKIDSNQAETSSSPASNSWKTSSLARLKILSSKKNRELDVLENKLLRISSTTEDGSHERNTLSRTAKMVLSSRSGNLNSNNQEKMSSSPQMVKILKTTPEKSNTHPTTISPWLRKDEKMQHSVAFLEQEQETSHPVQKSSSLRPESSTEVQNSFHKPSSSPGTAEQGRPTETNSPRLSKFSKTMDNMKIPNPGSKTFFTPQKVTKKLTPIRRQSLGGTCQPVRKTLDAQTVNCHNKATSSLKTPTKSSNGGTCQPVKKTLDAQTGNRQKKATSSLKTPTKSGNSLHAFKGPSTGAEPGKLISANGLAGEGIVDDPCSKKSEETELSNSEIKNLKRSIQRFFNTLDIDGIDPDNITLKELRMTFEATYDVQLDKDGRQYFKTVTANFLELAMTVKQHKQKEQCEASTSLVNGTPSRKRKPCEDTVTIRSPPIHVGNSPAKVRRISQDGAGTSSNQDCEIISVGSREREVQCPICMNFFEQTIISDHAAVCGEEDGVNNIENQDDLEITSVTSPSRPRNLPGETIMDLSDNMRLSEEEKRHWNNFSKRPKPYHPRMDKALFRGCQLLKCPTCGQHYKSEDIEEHSDECADKVHSGLEKRGLYYVRKDNKLAKRGR